METERLKIAVEFLKDGQSFTVGHLKLGMGGKNEIYVTGWSKYSYLENLTKIQAQKELEEIKEAFHIMVNLSKELESFIQNKKIKYNLAFVQGMSSICICSDTDGVVKWEMEPK